MNPSYLKRQQCWLQLQVRRSIGRQLLARLQQRKTH
ncbi:Uncharacterised protein [Vibrio cholerae]|nr:Uncharacterised protein [Vibrio cholerae]